MRILGRKGAIFSALVFLILVGVSRINSESPERFETEGIVIELKAVATEMDGYRTFDLRIMNLTETPRSVHGRFRLLSRSGQDAGSCTLFVELSPGQSRTRQKACKETALSHNYRFEILRVYPFVLDSP